MAQQAISQRELSGNWAGNRRAPTLGIGGKPPTDEGAANLAAFAQDLDDFGDDLQQGRKRRAAEEKARKDAQKIKDDAEAERLKIKAKRRELESSGQDYKTAHGISVLDSGEPGQKARDQGDPDVMNPIYRKEYERAYTGRKVEQFQTNLDARSEKEVGEMYNVWKQGFGKEGHPANGISFEYFASEALSRRKDDIFANELSHLPHLGEFADKISFKSYTDNIAKFDQEFRDETKRKFLNGAVNDHLESFAPEGRTGLPRPQTKDGKEISAASDLLNKAEGLMGKQVTEDGQLRGIYSKNEVHGAFIKEFSDRITLADDPNDPIFESLDTIFDSPDAHKLLNLDPNNPQGIGKQYEDIKSKAESKFISLSNKKESTDKAKSKEITDQHTGVVQNLYARASSLKLKAEEGNLDISELEELKAIVADEDSYSKGKLEFLDDSVKIISQLSGPDIKSSSTPLTQPEATAVKQFTENELSKVDNLEDLADLRKKILHGKDGSRPKMAKIKALDAQKKALEDRNAGRKIKRDIFKENSTEQMSSLQTNYKTEASNIRKIERSKDGKRSGALKKFLGSIDKRKETIRNRVDLSAADKLTAIASLEAEAKDLEQEENTYLDGQQTESFYNYLQDPTKFNSEKITDKNRKELQKKIDKIKDPSLRKTLNSKLTEITDNKHSQDSLKEEFKNLKVADKAFSIFGKELNGIKALGSEAGLAELKKLQEKYEEDENFLEQLSKDPSKRNFLDDIVQAEQYLLAKVPEEKKEAERKIALEGVEKSKEERTGKQNEAMETILALEEDYSIENYNAAFSAITAEIDMNQLEGPPIKDNIYAEERRTALIDRINDIKTKSSGRVPTIGSKEFDPTIYTKYEEKIAALKSLEGQPLIDAVKAVKLELKEQYHGFEVPQQIYEDFSNELDSSIPGSPVTLSPVVHGRKTVRSAFLGKFDKYDDSSEFQLLGGKEGADLYEKIRAVYERKVTAATKKEDWKALTAEEKLEKTELIASNLLNTKLTPEEGGMDEGWRSRMEIYSAKWEEAQKLKEKQDQLTTIQVDQDLTAGGQKQTIEETTTDRQLINFQIKNPFNDKALYTSYKDDIKKVTTTKVTKYVNQSMANNPKSIGG
tara:strand:+ start:11548 stop:14892 length:3345 start_codon:yes stop_codon:yes gene_type:complete